MNISQQIICIRENKGIKQSEIAQILNIEQSNYSRLEKRGNKLTLEQLEKIADALDVPLSEILGISTENQVIDEEEHKRIQLKEQRRDKREEREAKMFMVAIEAVQSFTEAMIAQTDLAASTARAFDRIMPTPQEEN